MGVDVDQWCEGYSVPNGLAPEGIAFLQFRNNLLSTFDPAKMEKSFATPRTWDKALRYFVNKETTEDIRWTAIAGAVGDGVAAEFKGFLDVWQNMVSMDSIEKDPMGVELPAETSMCYALSIAVSGTMTPKNVKPFHTFLKRLSPEYAILAWKMAVTRDEDLFNTDEFLDCASEYKAVFSVN